MEKRYFIEGNSILQLRGTTNVNAFTCDCEDNWPAQVIRFESSAQHASFDNTALRLRTKKFNCRNPKMDHDMRKALKADQYPFIAIELLETWQQGENLKTKTKEWTDVRAKAAITITNVKKQHIIHASAMSLGQDRFRLKGSKKLNMSDFGVDPPEALFGMIKVNDEIEFHFDLYIRVEDAP